MAPSIDLGRACDEVFGTHGDMEQLVEWVRNASAFPSWMREWLEIERSAHTLRSWQPLVVDGLLQTEAYARELVKTYPWHDDEQVEELTAARLDRQSVLASGSRPILWVVLHENVLRCEVGTPAIMREQLQALVEASRRPRVTVQVVPLSAGMHAGHLGAFLVAGIDGSPDVVYSEHARSGLVSQRPEDVHEVVNIWEAIRMEALPPRASLDLIEKVAEQWT
ncbi:MAG: DUF5753 domain-containing protein [Nocardioidaceae bacterium]